jgi:hypothetical protein
MVFSQYRCSFLRAQRRIDAITDSTATPRRPSETAENLSGLRTPASSGDELGDTHEIVGDEIEQEIGTHDGNTDHFWLAGSFCDPETDIARLAMGNVPFARGRNGSTRHEVRGTPPLSRRLQPFRVLRDAA